MIFRPLVDYNRKQWGVEGNYTQARWRLFSCYDIIESESPLSAIPE
ncbi:hypothetical protein KJ866_03680 [Patescibacteria group bacterium]|nr:hypothetical protein [Patescibacteria group bacterium]MBU2264972.1 hypothetical protein [Patescibacteria group bacterium]